MDEIVEVLCPLKVQLVSIHVHIHTAVCVYMVFIAHLLYTCIYLLPISVMFIHYLLPTTRHTGSLECFHNVMLGYATKRISYRCMLCTFTCKHIVIETKERDSKSIHVCNVLLYIAIHVRTMYIHKTARRGRRSWGNSTYM